MLRAAPGLRPVAVFEEMQRRHPGLSAGARRTAFRNLDHDAREDLTRRYDTLCAQHGMQPTRNNAASRSRPAPSRALMAISGNAVGDALLMRGVSDEIVSRKNVHHAKRIEAERPALQQLPGPRTCDHEETLVTVTSSGGWCSGSKSRALEAAINRLDRFHLLILDLAYVSKDQAETSVLFELISARQERGRL